MSGVLLWRTHSSGYGNATVCFAALHYRLRDRLPARPACWSARFEDLEDASSYRSSSFSRRVVDMQYPAERVEIEYLGGVEI